MDSFDNSPPPSLDIVDAIDTGSHWPGMSGVCIGELVVGSFSRGLSLTSNCSVSGSEVKSGELIAGGYGIFDWALLPLSLPFFDF